LFLLHTEIGESRVQLQKLSTEEKNELLHKMILYGKIELTSLFLLL